MNLIEGAFFVIEKGTWKVKILHMNEDEKSSNLQWEWIGQEVWCPQENQEEFCTLKQKIGLMGGGGRLDWKMKTNTHITKGLLFIF